MAQIPIQIVDAFAERPFTGQPAAIIPNASGLTDEQMLQIAEELGMEAGFVMPPAQREADVRLRFFTRRREATFSGHVVVAAFLGLADRGFFKPTAAGLQLHQETAAGVFAVTLTREADRRTRVSFELPRPRFGELVPAAEVATALDIPLAAIGLNDHGPQRVSCGFDVIVVPVARREVMRGSFRNLDTMRELADRRGVSGFALFCPHTFSTSADFHCRFLFPAEVCCEEPVSGTSLASVSAYAVEHGLLAGDERVEVVTEQGHSMGRPSQVVTEVRSLGGRVSRVCVTGTGMVVMRGALTLVPGMQAAAV
ncbi:MAG: PhzF family phenazine biosynthesis protein [Candidatus Krumholzibacteriia bacterium]